MIRTDRIMQSRRDKNGRYFQTETNYYITEDGMRFTTRQAAERHELEQQIINSRNRSNRVTRWYSDSEGGWVEEVDPDEDYLEELEEEPEEEEEIDMVEEFNRMRDLDSYDPISHERRPNRAEREQAEADEIRRLIERLMIPIEPVEEPRIVATQVKKRKDSNVDFKDFEMPRMPKVEIPEEPKAYEVKKGSGRKIFVLKGE